jgi:hypothetical protein
MSTSTNAHTGIFTLIPKKISKTWGPRIFNIATKGATASAGLHHEASIVKEVILEVKFDETMTIPRDEFVEEDEIATDHSAAWNEARKDWLALENAIETAIKSFAERTFNRAVDARTTTGELLVPRRTTVVRHGGVDSGTASTNKRSATLKPAYAETDVSSLRTIRPSDSLSNAPLPARRSAPIRAMTFMDFVRT